MGSKSGKQISLNSKPAYSIKLDQAMMYQYVLNWQKQRYNNIHCLYSDKASLQPMNE